MDTEVVVHRIGSNSPLCRTSKFALFRWPEMTLMEQPSSYLAHLGRRSPSIATSRNSAYALSYWFNFCRAADIDWQHSSIDDLYDYKTALETTVSQKTGARRSAGTSYQYVGAVVEFYDFAAGRCWYAGDIRKSEAPQRAIRADHDKLAHTKSGALPTRKRSPIAQKRNRSGTMIKPLSIGSLQRLLSEMGPDANDAPAGSSVRNRLIADWGWAVGLRISEILSLRADQFSDLVVDPSVPWVHFSIEVLGKGNKLRRVSVPSWLIEHTQIYVRGERQRCVALGRTSEERLFVSTADSKSPGQGITPRRVEAIFGAACLRAGLFVNVRRLDPETGLMCLRQVPAHCVHDLRHTYAVLTYHAEVTQGNSEPWKKIQAQLGHSSLKTTTDIYLEYVNAHNDFRNASIRDLVGLSRR